MNFGAALEIVKQGGSACRAGWNGKSMHIYLVTPSNEGITPKMDPFIALYTAKGTIQSGWLASQADMLAEDWITLE